MLKGLLFLLVVVSGAVANAAPFSLPNVAADALALTMKELEKGGVKRMDPYHPSLPYPQVSAMEALVNPKTGAFCYYDQEDFAVFAHVFKNRQGGNRHSISWTADHIQFSTPYRGNVAHANRFKTIAGWDYNFWCEGSYQVTKAQWDLCVQRLFILPLRIQMTGS